MRIKMTGNKNQHLITHMHSHRRVMFGLHNEIPTQILEVYIGRKLSQYNVHNIFVTCHFQHNIHFLSLLYEMKEKYFLF